MKKINTTHSRTPRIAPIRALADYATLARVRGGATPKSTKDGTLSDGEYADWGVDIK